MATDSARLRVLIAEDEFLIAMELADELHAMGAEVVAVAPTLAGARAAALAAARIDVAVLDIDLRGELAYPLADELLARGIAIVFATGYDASSIPPRYAHVECCVKPVMGGTLTRAVRRAAGDLRRPSELSRLGEPEPESGPRL